MRNFVLEVVAMMEHFLVKTPRGGPCHGTLQEPCWASCHLCEFEDIINIIIQGQNKAAVLTGNRKVSRRPAHPGKCGVEVGGLGLWLLAPFMYSRASKSQGLLNITCIQLP